MSGLFSHSAPKMPAPAPAPIAPTIDEAQKAADTQNALRQKRGAMSTVLAGNNPTPPTGALVRLLGQ